jgi:hypothetical protein
MRNLSDLLTWKYLHTGAVDDLQLAIIWAEEIMAITSVNETPSCSCSSV